MSASALGRVKTVQRGETGREPTQERRYRLNLPPDRLLWFGERSERSGGTRCPLRPLLTATSGFTPTVFMTRVRCFVICATLLLEGEPLVHVTYQIIRHDDGWAYTVQRRVLGAISDTRRGDGMASRMPLWPLAILYPGVAFGNTPISYWTF
jgi:hypothetical protein